MSKAIQAPILFIVFAGALGYLLGMFLGLLGIVLAMVIVFAVGIYLTNNNSSSSSNKMLLPMKAMVKIRYRCLSCYTIHNKRECPRCGSRIKQVEF